MNDPIATDRRAFIKRAGLLTGMLAASSPLALLTPTRSWAVDLSTFSSVEGATLMAVMRTIAPHDKLEDAAYALVVQSLDSEAANDETVLGMLRDGIASLGKDFASATEDQRVAALKRIESSGFFQTLRGKTMGGLYATPFAYAYFGYEGEAFSKGGYLYRGFDEMRWLPDVAPQDSGPMPGAN